MTREDLENLVLEATGRTDKVTLIRSALNLALEEVSAAAKWRDLEVEESASLPSGTSSLTLVSTLSRVSEVRLMNGLLSRPLLIMPKNWVVERFPALDILSPSWPVYGYLEGHDLYFAPRPFQDFSVRYTYFRLHPQFTLATDVLLLRHAGAAVAAYATFWVFQSLEKSTDAERWLAIFQRQLASAIKIDRENAVVIKQMVPRSDSPQASPAYYLDPFVRQMP